MQRSLIVLASLGTAVRAERRLRTWGRADRMLIELRIDRSYREQGDARREAAA